MSLRFIALPADAVAAVRAGGPDAHGQPAERDVSDGDGLPCRHCLCDIPAGREMLTLAWRPFPDLQPYAEAGPVFLCADCQRREDGPDLPPVLASRPRFMVRGYSAADRIVYGTGGIVETPDLARRCVDLLADGRVAYLHLRSAVNGCYQLRVERGGPDR